MMPDSTYAS